MPSLLFVDCNSYEKARCFIDIVFEQLTYVNRVPFSSRLEDTPVDSISVNLPMCVLLLVVHFAPSAMVKLGISLESLILNPRSP